MACQIRGLVGWLEGGGWESWSWSLNGGIVRGHPSILDQVERIRVQCERSQLETGKVGRGWVEEGSLPSKRPGSIEGGSVFGSLGGFRGSYFSAVVVAVVVAAAPDDKMVRKRGKKERGRKEEKKDGRKDG